MSRLDPKYRSTLAEVSMPETPVILLTLDHPGLPEPVRVVNNTEELVSNNKRYIAFPFSVTLPDDFENRLPRARIEISNVGREVMYWLETSNGGAGSTATFDQVLPSDPDNIVYSVTMSLFNITADNTVISAELGYENLFAKAAVQVSYRPFNSPGLF